MPKNYMNNVCFEEEVKMFSKAKISTELIDEEQATAQIKKLIQFFKSRQIKKIDIIDIASALNLPVNQINKIMLKLERENLVKENE